MAITVNMPNGSTMEFPDGTSYDDIRATLSGRPDTPAPGKADTSDKIGWVDAIGQGIMNLPKSAYDNGKAMVDAVVNYEDTGRALAGLGKGLALKGYRYLTGNGDGAKYPEEVYPDAFGKYIADRYGSADGWKNTIAKDPFGVMTDLSTFFTGGAGAAKGLATGVAKAGKVGADLSKGLRAAGNVASRAAEITDPVQVGMKTLYNGAKYAYGRGMDPAKKLYQSALGPSMAFGKNPKYSDEQIKAMVAAGLNGRIPVNEDGIAKAAMMRKQLGNELQGEIEAATKAGVRLDPEQIAKGALDSPMRRKIEITDFSDGKKKLSKFDDTVAGFLDEYPMGEKTTPLDIQERKVALNEELAPNLMNSTKKKRKASEIEADNALRHSMMTSLEDSIPAVHDINQQIGTLKDLEPELLRAATRGNGKSVVDLLKGGAVGATTQNPAAAAAAAVGAPFMASPGIKSRIAFGLDWLGKHGNPARPGLAMLNVDAQAPAITQWYMDPRDGYGNDPRVKGLLDLLARKQSVKK